MHSLYHNNTTLLCHTILDHLHASSAVQCFTSGRLRHLLPSSFPHQKRIDWNPSSPYLQPLVASGYQRVCALPHSCGPRRLARKLECFLFQWQCAWYCSSGPSSLLGSVCSCLTSGTESPARESDYDDNRDCGVGVGAAESDCCCTRGWSSLECVLPLHQHQCVAAAE